MDNNNRHNTSPAPRTRVGNEIILGQVRQQHRVPAAYATLREITRLASTKADPKRSGPKTL